MSETHQQSLLPQKILSKGVAKSHCPCLPTCLHQVRVVDNGVRVAHCSPPLPACLAFCYAPSAPPAQLPPHSPSPVTCQTTRSAIRCFTAPSLGCKRKSAPPHPAPRRGAGASGSSHLNAPAPSPPGGISSLDVLCPLLLAFPPKTEMCLVPPLIKSFYRANAAVTTSWDRAGPGTQVRGSLGPSGLEQEAAGGTPTHSHACDPWPLASMSLSSAAASWKIVCAESTPCCVSRCLPASRTPTSVPTSRCNHMGRPPRSPDLHLADRALGSALPEPALFSRLCLRTSRALNPPALGTGPPKGLHWEDHSQEQNSHPMSVPRALALCGLARRGNSDEPTLVVLHPNPLGDPALGIRPCAMTSWTA